MSRKHPSSKTPKPSSKTPKRPIKAAEHDQEAISASEEADKQSGEGQPASDGADKQRGEGDPASDEGAKQRGEGQPASVGADKQRGDGQTTPTHGHKPSGFVSLPNDGRALTLAVRPDGIAVLTLDIPGEPVNTLHAYFTTDFNQALGEVEAAVDAGTVRGVVFISGKRDNFLAGADINMLKAAQTPAEATQLSQRGQEAMQRLEELGQRVPVVAAIHGACLGGGLELALACSARVCSDDGKTVLGQPEVQLGLIPGAGGTQRLPRLVGVEQALDLILTGKQLKAQRALKAGIVDEVVPRAILLDAAVARAKRIAGERANPGNGAPFTAALRRFAQSVNGPRIKQLLLEDNPLGRKVLFDKAKQTLLEKTRGNYPAPERALEVIRVGLEEGSAAGFAAEAQAFGGLLVSPQAAQLINVFQTQNALKKDRGSDDSNAVPRPLHKIGVVGAGMMGAGIAYVSVAQAGLFVRLRDKDDTAIAHGLKSIRDIFDERVKKKSLPARDAAVQMAHVTPAVDSSGFADVEVVIEAVFEDLTLKQKVLREVEANGRPDVIFASNTSSLPITGIAEASAHPETVIGMHYFSPVQKMPLLEVITTEKTAPWVIATCVELGKKQGKTVIVVRDGVGFYTSRILAPYLNEAAHLLAAGVPIERIDDALLDFGFPVGPLTLLDEVGIDIAEKVGHIVHQAFGERLTPPAGIDALIKNGRYGKKNGRGFYRYDLKKQHGKRRVDPTVYAELGLKIPASSKESPLSDEEIQLRCVLAMVNEAALCLQEGILRSPRDGDIGAIFGLGFPPFLGGPFHFVDALGAAEVVRRLRELEEKHGKRFAPAAVLVEMAEKRKRFF